METVKYDVNSSLEAIKKSCVGGIDKLTRTISWFKDYRLIYNFIEYTPEVDTKENMSRLENSIMWIAEFCDNPLIAYEFMYEMATDFEIKNFDLERFEKYIISIGNPKFMDYCIRCIKGTNVPRMLNALYDTKNVKYIARVKAEYEHGVNAKLYPSSALFGKDYDEALNVAKNTLYTPKWFKDFRHSNLEELCMSVIENKTPYYINELADYFEYLLEFVIQKDDYNNISLFEVLIEMLNHAMMKYGQMLDKYEYAWSVNRVDKTLLQKDVIQDGDPKFMYYFREIPGANVKELDEAINLTGNEKYINLIKDDRTPSGENILTLG